ncbi:MAG: hypothetical protein K1Y02_24230 [Candidatus Hydrogenedentes bacterium]|nr:hypothetical protein [Candidatus Hydrogenedentota bacterium]
MNTAASKSGYSRLRTVTRLAGLFFVILTAFCAYHAILSWRVRAEVNSLRAQGLPVTLEELSSWYKTPAGPNAADLYLKAFASIQEPPQPLAMDLPIAGEGDLPEYPAEIPEETIKAIGEYVSANADAITLLHQAADIPKCRFPLVFESEPNTGLALSLDITKGARASARLLTLDAVLAAASRDSERAHRSLLACIILSNALIDVPDAAGFLLAIAIRDIGVQDLNRLLDSGEFSQAQFESLSRALTEKDGHPILQISEMGSRCQSLHYFAHRPSWFDASSWQRNGESLSEWLTAGTAGAHIRDLLGITKIGLASYLRSSRELAENLHSDPSTIGHRLDALQREASSLMAGSEASKLANMTAYTTKQQVGTLLRWSVRSRLFQCLLAVERFRRDRSLLPASIEELTPSYCASAPIDPYSGMPMKLRPAENGFVVYSVGPNQIDDGGVEIEPQLDDMMWGIPPPGDIVLHRISIL